MTQSNQARSPNMHVVGEDARLGEDILAALGLVDRRRDPAPTGKTPSTLHVLGEGTELGTNIIRSVRDAFRPVARDRM